jgi:hypothetical protein
MHFCCLHGLLAERVTCVFAEEFVVLDADSLLWAEARSLLNAALHLEQQDDQFVWHGWQKQHITTFLQNLPSHCALLAGVWMADDGPEERLVLGLVCEVMNGEISSLRTFESLVDSTLPAISVLEPGFEHARELLRVTKAQVAPVAWAIFTDLATWQEWLFTEESADRIPDKAELLASLARQGRCVLMGSQVMHHHI